MVFECIAFRTSFIIVVRNISLWYRHRPSILSTFSFVSRHTSKVILHHFHQRIFHKHQSLIQNCCFVWIRRMHIILVWKCFFDEQWFFIRMHSIPYMKLVSRSTYLRTMRHTCVCVCICERIHRRWSVGFIFG